MEGVKLASFESPTFFRAVWKKFEIVLYPWLNNQCELSKWFWNCVKRLKWTFLNTSTNSYKWILTWVCGSVRSPRLCLSQLICYSNKLTPFATLVEKNGESILMCVSLMPKLFALHVLHFLRKQVIKLFRYTHLKRFSCGKTQIFSITLAFQQRNTPSLEGDQKGSFRTQNLSLF